MKRLFVAIIFACLLPTAAIADGIGPKPGRWCGWFMQHETGITSGGTGLNLNRAIEWRKVGQATVAAVGAIVVWSHHVGVIVGEGVGGRWLVKSGNDGNAVRTRERSLRGAVAFRSVGTAFASLDPHISNEKAPARRYKHLVAHAVGGGTAEPLRQARALTVVASVVPIGLASAPFTHGADLADEVGRHKRKPVRQPQGPVFGGDVKSADAIGGVFAAGEMWFSHDASPKDRCSGRHRRCRAVRSL